MGTPNETRTYVVIIDDNIEVGRMLKMVLERKNFRADVYSDAVTGVRMIQGNRPQIVILDIKMPERDGFWAFSEIRKFDPDVPIIFNSAYQDLLPPEEMATTFKPFGIISKNGRVIDFVKMVEAAAKSMKA